VHSVSDVKQIEILVRTTEPSVLVSSRLAVKIANAVLKKYNSPSINQFPAELIQAGGETYCPRSINSLILFGIRKNLIA
jgi:hypothetical protein